MFDNVLNGALFASVSGVAVAATVQIVQAEVELDRPALAASAASTNVSAEPLWLPKVVVTGHRMPDISAGAEVSSSVVAVS